jgi:hypothetical protein
MEALKTNHIKTVLFILRIIDKEEKRAMHRADAFTPYNLNASARTGSARACNP